MRWRLLAAFLGVMAVILIAQDVPLAGHLRRVERDRQLADLERDAFVLAGSSFNALAGDAAALGNLSGTADNYGTTTGRGVVITDVDGVVIAASRGEADRLGDDLSDEPDIAAALATDPAAADDDDTVSIAVPVLSGANAVGVVRLSSPASAIDRRADERTRGLVVVGVISLAAAGVAALVMANSVTGPLRRLQQSTERVAAGDFGARADQADGPPEVRSLAASFNSMTARVASLVDQQRAFAGDASHQLRTPLTALRLQLERLSDLVDSDPAGARRNVDNASAEIERLQRLIDGLLMLARTDASTARPVGRVDVSAVVADRVAVWQPLGEEQDVTIVGRCPPGVLARAVEDGLDQILDNLIDNALAAAPAGSSIEVIVDTDTRSAAGAVRIHALDRGPGLTPTQLAAAFDRFWRAPGAAHDGSGLGLAIVAQLAQASGGEVRLDARVGGGVDAVATLPGLASGARTPS